MPPTKKKNRSSCQQNEYIQDTNRSTKYKKRFYTYPPRLMVDFTRMNVNTLRKYIEFYRIPLTDNFPTDQLAAVVARHFDGTLEISDETAICNFLHRVRNGPGTSPSILTNTLNKVINIQGLQRPTRQTYEKKEKKDSKLIASSNCNDNNIITSSTNNNIVGTHKTRKNKKNNTNYNHSNTSKKRNRENDYLIDEEYENNNTKKSIKTTEKTQDVSISSTSNNAVMDADGEDLYCICSKPSYGDMIACDAEYCPQPSQWYHLECVNLIPGKHPNRWLCPQCDSTTKDNKRSYKSVRNKKR